VPIAAARRARAQSVVRAATIVAALLIETILILGFVVLSLGLGAEARSGFGPDRPPPPPTPAPALPPDLVPGLEPPANAIERPVLEGRDA